MVIHNIDKSILWQDGDALDEVVARSTYAAAFVPFFDMASMSQSVGVFTCTMDTNFVDSWLFYR